jgi:hypothetical protein
MTTMVRKMENKKKANARGTHGLKNLWGPKG